MGKEMGIEMRIKMGIEMPKKTGKNCSVRMKFDPSFIFLSFYLFIFLSFSYQCSSVFICGSKAFLCVSVPPWLIPYAQAREDCQGRLFCALAAFSYWADARWAAVFTWACGDQFASLCEQRSVPPIEWFGEADSAGVRVIQIQVRLEELLFR